MPMYNPPIKNGHVIDTVNNIDGLMDVGVAGRSIAAVEANIPELVVDV